MHMFGFLKILIRHGMMAGCNVVGAVDQVQVDMSILTPLYAGGPGLKAIAKKRKRGSYNPPKSPGIKNSSTLFSLMDGSAAMISKMMTTPSFVKMLIDRESFLFPAQSAPELYTPPRRPATPTVCLMHAPSLMTSMVLSTPGWLHWRTTTKRVRQKCS
jgi:hypothetical protein